jgi:hypothetical protein
MKHRLAISGPAAGIVAVSLLTPVLLFGDDEKDPVPAAGESCVYLRDIRRTDIVDDRNVIFHMRGSGIYLNRLPNRCPGLKIADSFMYSTSLTALCNVDIIRPLRQQAGGFRPGPGCGLGRFEPITEEEIALLKNKDIEIDGDAVTAEIEDLDEGEAAAE